MAIYQLDERLWFPPVEEAEPDGLIGFGGNLSSERLLLAYRSGIFPWFSGDDPILWWSPDPRFILYPEKLKISKSMRQVLNQGIFSVTFNKNFEEVITECGQISRKGQDGTWITQEMKTAYIKLHLAGFAHSVEVWQNEKLSGGLYGVQLGKCFFGESMFSKVSNASKTGFITFVDHLKSAGCRLIDCQVYTQHLESLGAEMIPRELFMKHLNEYL